jgi:uncharacterized protein
MDVQDNPDASRYEISVDGELAGFAAYRRSPDEIIFTHTEVDDAYEGRGVGSALAKAALDGARTDSLQVVPACEFIAAYIDRHEEYRDLLGE